MSDLSITHERRRWTDRWVLLATIPFVGFVAVVLPNQPAVSSTFWAVIGIGVTLSAPIALIISFVVAARHTSWIGRLRTPLLLGTVGGAFVVMAAAQNSGGRVMSFIPKSALIRDIGLSISACALIGASLLLLVGLYRSFTDREEYL